MGDTCFRLVMRANSTTPFPHVGEPGKLKIGLREIVLTGFPIVEDDTEFAHICISPAVNIRTYLPNRAPLSSVKTFTIDGPRVSKNFSQEMEFFQIDSRDQSFIRVEVVDNKSHTLVVSGVLLFDLYAI